MRHERSSGIIVYKNNNNGLSFLFLVKKDGVLDFPKGHVEKGESEKESAIRETREETGLELQPDGKFRYIQEYWYRYAGERIKKTVTMFLSRAPHDADVKISFEHQGFRWLSYEEALTNLSFKNQKEMLTEALSQIKRQDS